MSAVATLEHVEDLAGGHVDHRSDEPPAPSAMRGLHHRLVEADHRHRRNPSRVVHPCGAVPFDRGPHRRPRHPEASGDRRRHLLDRRHMVRGPGLGSAGEHPPRGGQLGVFGPGLGRTVRIWARPDPLGPPRPHCDIADRGVAQSDPPAVLGPGAGPAPRTARDRPGRLHLDHHLAAALGHAENPEPGRAEPDRAATTFCHRGPPPSRTFKPSRDSWRPPPQRGPSHPKTQLHRGGPRYSTPTSRHRSSETRKPSVMATWSNSL